MNIAKTKNFLNQFEGLPNSIKEIYEKQEEIFLVNWFDSRLHVKRLKELKGIFSFRVTRRYRVLFYFQNREVVFFSVDHRKDIYE
jgi:mRNA-degrading endonuclease RelE of RelBE toxin-antitoxin system